MSIKLFFFEIFVIGYYMYFFKTLNEPVQLFFLKLNNKLPIKFISNLISQEENKPENKPWIIAWSFLFLCWLHYQWYFLRAEYQKVIMCLILLMKVNRIIDNFVSLIIRHFIDFIVIFVTFRRWCEWILHKKSRGYVFFKHRS